jgi:hypothetical protein
MIKIRSTASFGGEEKPSVICRKILRHVKVPYEYEKIFRRQNSRPFIAKFILIRYQISLSIIPESSGG